MLPPPTILGSNTSSISLTRLAAAAARQGASMASVGLDEGNERAGRVVGIHFFNPVPQM